MVELIKTKKEPLCVPFSFYIRLPSQIIIPYMYVYNNYFVRMYIDSFIRDINV